MHNATVVIPTLNRAKLLRETLTSVYAQENVNLEVIVIDDDSDDDTYSVVQAFPDVKYVHQKRSGPNTARNLGLSMASNDYIALLDDDDLWEPFKLDLELTLLDQEPDAAFIFSNFSILRLDGQRYPDGLGTWHIPEDKWNRLLSNPLSMDVPASTTIPGHELDKVEYHLTPDLYSDLLEDPFVMPTTAVIRKSALTDEIRFVDDDYICGDWEFFARLAKKHHGIYIDIDTAANRSHEDAIRLTRTPERIQLAKRLRMVSSVWAADDDFMDQNGTRVHNIQAHYHATLAKLALQEGAYPDVRENLKKAIELQPDSGILLKFMDIFSSLPGSLALVHAADQGARRVRDWVHGK